MTSLGSKLISAYPEDNQIFSAASAGHEPFDFAGELDILGASAGVFYENVPRMCLKHHEVVDLLQARGSTTRCKIDGYRRHCDISLPCYFARNIVYNRNFGEPYYNWGGDPPHRAREG